MIGSIFHKGSGAGNQLFRFIASKVLAEEKGFEHGMVNPGNFKCDFFINFPLKNGMNVDPNFNYWIEKEIRDSNGTDIRSYDPEINFVQDNTIIDGEFQDERYFKHRLKDIDTWLKVKPLDLPDDLCIIGFRGGEYAGFPELFLPKEYWDDAILIMRLKRPHMRFEVHTDDPVTAKQFFPDFPIVSNTMESHSKHSNMGLNWRSIRYAKNLIIANSSFYILPALLNEGCEHVIAPRYWARHNTGVWATPQNYYEKFQYI